MPAGTRLGSADLDSDIGEEVAATLNQNVTK